MGRNNVRRHIVCRMLDRGKGIDFFPHRQYDYAARMLPGGPADAYASLYDPVDLAKTLVDAALFVVALDLAERCLICQRTDGPRAERLPGAENHLGIFMGLALVIA